jgi:D-alanyl-D-alanine carboxypeptidase
MKVRKILLQLLLGMLVILIPTIAPAANLEKKHHSTKQVLQKKTVKKKFRTLKHKKVIKLATPTKRNIAKASRATCVNPKYAALIINPATGQILHQENADKLRHPASLTKMMTIYLTFEAIAQRKLNMNKLLTVSSKASQMPRSHLALKPGELISVKNALLGLIVKSANDSAVVLAEAIAGSEQKFAKVMNERAAQLGMTSTNFRNASGWHDKDQKTTAIDMAKLVVALKRDFPRNYSLLASTCFTFKGKIIHGHDRVKQHYAGTEGGKTGFVNASGFNIVTSVKRGKNCLVGVVLGGPSAKARDHRIMSLFDLYFSKLKSPVVKISYNQNSDSKRASVQSF